MAALVAVSLACNLLRLGVVVMLLSVAVTATRVPGLKWDALEVWEASALPGASQPTTTPAGACRGSSKMAGCDIALLE